MNLWRFLFIATVVLFCAIYSLRNGTVVNEVLRLRLEHELTVAAGHRVAIDALSLSSFQQLELRAISLELGKKATLTAEKLTVDGEIASICLGFSHPSSFQFSNSRLTIGDMEYGPLQISCHLTPGNTRTNPSHIDIEITGQWQGKVTGELCEKQYLINGGLTHLLGAMMKIEGFLPTAKEQPMELLVSSEGELPTAVHEALPSHIFLMASYDGQFKLSGTPAAPKWHGEAHLFKGSAESFVTGAMLQDIEAHIVATPAQLAIRSITARDEQSGTLAGSGIIELDNDGALLCSLDAKLTKITLAALDELHAMVSGNLQLRGNASQLLLGGALEVDKCAIDLESAGPTLPNSFDVSFSDSASVRAVVDKGQEAVSSATQSKIPLTFDLNFISKGGVSITNDELTSLWSGRVNFRGSARSPQLYGDMRLTQGEYQLSGRKFSLKEGVISFEGDPRSKTTLYLVAQLAIENIVAEAVLSGAVTTPHLQFRSTPPMSQREILSWILFGCGSGEISSFQGAELARSINLLKSNKGESANPFDGIKESIGLDRIEINRGSGDEGFSLQLGKFLAPSVFLGVTKSITAQKDRIGIEVNVSKEMKFNAEVDNDAQSKFQLKWKRDY